MKALKILKKWEKAFEYTKTLTSDSKALEGLNKDLEEVNEAIKELEALENKSCDGCKHYETRADLNPCAIAWICSRGIIDRFEPKE